MIPLPISLPRKMDSSLVRFPVPDILWMPELVAYLGRRGHRELHEASSPIASSKTIALCGHHLGSMHYLEQPAVYPYVREAYKTACIRMAVAR